MDLKRKQNRHSEDSVVQNICPTKKLACEDLSLLKDYVDDQENKLNLTLDLHHGPSMNISITQEETKNYLHNSWKNNKSLLNEIGQGHGNGSNIKGIEFVDKPFKLGVVNNFLQDPKFLQELKSELLKLEFIAKCNDLYQYHQSADLSTVKLPSIVSFRKMMQTECREWLSAIIGKELLEEKMTMNCSSYNYTDYLLCHDDQTEDRLIAFVLYFNSEKWSEQDGGQLELFDVDEHRQPRNVSEILTADRTRLSINGWFHGLPNPPPLVYHEHDLTCSPALKKSKSYEMNLMNQMFLAPDVQESISTEFEEANEILLTPFLNYTHFVQIASDLKQENISWKFIGPANRRRYEIAVESSLPQSIQELLGFLKSEPMFALLQKFTNLDLESSGDETVSQPPTCYAQVQRWSPGCYTLLHDDDKSLSKKVLDANLYFNSVELYQGGFVSYIARDDDEELLTVAPSPNGLALTYRDEETLRFVKYVNCRMAQNVFHTISLTYHE